MINYKKTICLDELQASARAFLTPEMLFVDIETTGLSAENCFIYCIGCSWLKKDQICIQLLFGTGENDEPDLFTQFEALTRRFKKIVTFNGTTFDLPFLKKRLGKYQMADPITAMKHLDLFREAKKLRKLLSLDNYRQKSLELFLGSYRKDTYSGKELIRVYKTYCQTPTEELLQLLLLHNYEDVLGMYDLLGILAYQNFFNGAFSITRCALEENHLQIHLQPDTPLPQSVTRMETEWQLSIKSDRVFLQLPVHTGTLRHYFPDYKNYFYLPEEDTIIHKDIGIYVDRSRRSKATKENCFLSKNCSYLMISGNQKGYDSYLKTDQKDPAAYLEFDPKWLLGENYPALYDYLVQLFRFYLK